jgi:hypothetical protein
MDGLVLELIPIMDLLQIYLLVIMNMLSFALTLQLTSGGIIFGEAQQ